MPKRASTVVKGRTNVKGRADVRRVTMAAKGRTPAKAREVALPKEVSLGSSELKLWLSGPPDNHGRLGGRDGFYVARRSSEAE